MADVASHIVELRGTLGVRDAAHLARALEEAIGGHEAVTIAAGALEGADIAILQVLAAARKTAAKAGKPLRLEASEALTQTLIKAGLVAAEGAHARPDGDFWTGAKERAS